MLRLLHKIRRDLLANGKLGNYLWYAIGLEIIGLIDAEYRQ